MGERIIATSLILLLPFGAAGCGGGSSEPAARITSFEPASGTYRAEDEVVSSLRFRNTGDDKRTFWVGYSVQDGSGRWHDAPADPVSLGPGERSDVQERSWNVPKDSPLSGPYKVVMAVWNGDPEEDGARLASAEQEDAFHVIAFHDDFDSLDRDSWSVTSKVNKRLGRSYLKPDNVSVQDGSLRLKLSAGALDGGEIASRELYKYGSYRARIKVPDARSSITGFFLYEEPDFEKEIDIEIFNDPSGRIMFTTYAGGEETNNVKKNLPFDPTKNFHEYRFDFYAEKAEFYVDGELLHRFTKGLPEDPMRLYVNAWFPTWLSGRKPETEGYVYVDWLEN